MKSLLLAALAAAGAAGAQAAPLAYRLELIDAGAGSFNCAALNAHGDVAGTAVRDASVAYDWDAVAIIGGVPHAVGRSTGTVPAEAFAISGHRQMVGDIVAGTVDDLTHAATWTLDGAALRLPDYGRSSRALGVNRGGDIVGWADQNGRPRRAVRWSHGKIIDLSPGMAVGEAYAINDAGQAVGTAGPNGYAPVMFVDGGIVSLGSIGGTWGFALAVNAAGHAVGTATLADERTQHAFLSADAVMRDLGALTPAGSSAATGINDGDIVVGNDFETDVPHPIGVVWVNGVIHRLTDLLEPAAAAEGWEVWLASAINDRGQICGAGTNGAPILLTPVR